MSCLQPTIFEAPAFLASPSSSEGGVPFLDPFFFLFRLRTWRTIEARVVQHLTPHSDYCEARLLLENLSDESAGISTERGGNFRFGKAR